MSCACTQTPLCRHVCFLVDSVILASAETDVSARTDISSGFGEAALGSVPPDSLVPPIVPNVQGGDVTQGDRFQLADRSFSSEYRFFCLASVILANC